MRPTVLVLIVTLLPAVPSTPRSNRRIWAFVTVTNNVMQEVTTITPQ